MNKETLEATIRRFEALHSSFSKTVNACNLALKLDDFASIEAKDFCKATKAYNDGRASGMAIAINELRAIAQGY